MKKINLKDLKFKNAPNRKIVELVSKEVLGSNRATCRIVEINPIKTKEKRSPHFHLDVEEVVYVLEGEGEIWCEGETVKISKDDLILIPQKKKHMLTNVTNETLRIICFFPTNDMEATFVECKELKM